MIQKSSPNVANKTSALTKVEVNKRPKFTVNSNSTLSNVGISNPFRKDINPVTLGCVVGLWHGITERRLPLSTINSMFCSFGLVFGVTLSVEATDNGVLYGG